MKRPARRPVVLCVLDGWGWRETREANAVALARTPVFDRLWADCPRGFLQASERHVGLPDGQIGNSEVGHTNLGAGRVVMQDLPRIDAAIADGSLARNEALGRFIAKVKQSRGTCHLLGLVSPGGVHSHQRHLAALARAAAEAGVPVVVHAFLDGRDTPPKSGRSDMERFLADLAPDVRVGTVTGRFFAMDRDKRWERVEQAYAAVCRAEAGERAADPLAAVDAAYGRGETDEFVAPTVIADYAGMADGDGLLCGNFRADRVREILAALLDPEFAGFERVSRPGFAGAVGMTEYSVELDRFLETLFPSDDLTDTLGEVVAKAGLRQFRIAETEKYPHVTFFLNGGRETVFEGEDRVMVPSPKVKTYDLKPEMSAPEVADKLVEAIDSGTYDLVVVNFANPDMVGHTGVLEAAIKACETVDRCLGRLEEAVRRQGGVLLVTADHGNCEMMVDPETGGPHTAHTMNKVPAILVGGPPEVIALEEGRLADVAPTLLELLGLPKPAAMTGRSLLRRAALVRATGRRAAG